MELGLEYLESCGELNSQFQNVPGIYIPYTNPVTGKPSVGHPGYPAFFRVRYLKKVLEFGNTKIIRYTQEQDTGVCAYFPTNMDWPMVVSDPSFPIIITEGEFKAAKTCKEGFPTIGLGGTWNFKSTKSGVPFIGDLELVNWVKRTVYICFDSDFRANPNICRSMNALAEELMNRGATPYILPLPDVLEDGKTGLDDFFLHRTKEDFKDVMASSAQQLTMIRGLMALNEEVTYVYTPGMIIVHENGQKMNPGQFRDHAYSARNFHEYVVSDKGSISIRPANIGAAWLKWPIRKEVGRLTYAPGRPREILGPTVLSSAYNTWPGWGVQPKEGDVTMFLRLVDHLFAGASDEAKIWFLRWCAYPLQYPGVKMFSSVVIHGIEQGTGKSLIGYSLGRIYGKNFTEIKQQDLHGGFNEWAENKQLVLGDDITGSDRRADADMLKKLITQREIRLNAKHLPTYVVPDCINYIWTSNQPDAFFLEDHDRRMFIHEVTVSPMSEEFYVDYDMWLDTGGSNAIFQYLLDLDLGDFNPAAPAMRTAAKERMTDDVRSDLGSWVRMLLRNPDAVLKIGDMVLKQDLFTNRELLRIYDPMEKTRTTANGLGRELRRAGVPQVLDGVPIKTDDGQDRFYVLRNQSKWKTTTREAIRDHLTAHSGKKPAAKKF